MATHNDSSTNNSHGLAHQSSLGVGVVVGGLAGGEHAGGGLLSGLPLCDGNISMMMMMMRQQHHQHHQQQEQQQQQQHGLPNNDNNNNNNNAPSDRLFPNMAKDHRAFKDHPAAYDLGELEQPLSFNVSTSHQERSLGAISRVPLEATRTVLAPFNNSKKGQIHPSFELPTSQWMNGWDDAERVEKSPCTDTSTDVEPVMKLDAQASEDASYDVSQYPKLPDGVLAKKGDAKAMRRLAQNREAARKSRLRKKAYVQQLENGRMKLNQLEQEIHQSRQQGPSIGGIYSVNQTRSNEALAFDMDYASWLEEHNRLVVELRSGIHNHMGDSELRASVDSVMAHYEEAFRLKSVAAKGDVFHLISGIWKTPAERCFLWIGGYQPSGLLKIIIPQVEPLTEQQVLGICNLQQSSQQAEDALTQGMDTLLHTLAESLSGTPSPSGNVANYMGQMAIAMSKLGTFESFIRQADLLRLQALQQLQRILTTRQLARALLAIHDFFSRLRALSSLWSARPHD